MKKQALSLLLVLVLLVTAFAVVGQAETLPANGAYLVTQDAQNQMVETAEADPMTAWSTGEYDYIKLYADTTLTVPAETSVYVDLNGKNLTVAGEGELYAFNSANDGFTAAAGTVTNTGRVDVKTTVTAPLNGYRYVALTNGTVTTVHRIAMVLKAVTLRTEQAGLYYKATYNCDATLAAAVKNYGVILSVENMPGADFETETKNINKATSVTPDANFGNGTVTTSGSVFNIMKQEQSSLTNYANAGMKIYANAYIRLNTEAETVIVADEQNADLNVNDPDFTGIAYSLRDTLTSFDDNYYGYNKTDRATVEQFYSQWKTKGIRWAMEQVGKQVAIDNSNLNLVDGVAYCPVCKKDVQWTPVTSQNVRLATQNGKHYYLAEAVVTMDVPNASLYPNDSNSANGAVIAPPTGGTACLHLNGNKLTAPQNTAIFSSSGSTLNVMGNGEVNGFLNKTGVGNAVQLNATNGVINLYGGHYTQPAGKGVLFCATSGGGLLNVYAPCTVGEYANLRLAAGTRASTSKIALYGVDLSGSKLDFSDTSNRHPEKKCVLELVDSKFGTATVSDWNDVVLRGESTATLLTLNEDAKLTVGQLAPTASIGVKTNGGIITKEVANAAAAASCIKPNNAYQRVTVKDGALRCEKDYVTSEPVQKGYCPVCQKSVTWKAVTGQTDTVSGGHYYLAATQNYSGTNAFLNAPTSGTACFHLNGFNIDSAAAKVIYGAGSTLNVMGTGTVAGYTATENGGAAVQIDSGAINLYSGVYQQTADTNDSAYTVAAQNGAINVYADAKIVRTETDDKAIYVGAASGSNAVLDLHMTSVAGDVYVAGAQTGSAYTSQITVDGAEVDGDMVVDGANTMTLAHAPKLSYLKLAKETTITLGKLTTGADITVHTNGKFTASNDKAADYAGYFKAYNPAGSIAAENNVLVYSVDYSRPLSFTEGTTGVCPLCEKEVQWTELKADEAGTMVTLPTDGHYYLATPQTFTSSDTATHNAFVKAPNSGSACLHLNGQNMTATNVKAIYGNNGVLNVLGSGEVAGYSSSPNTGAAIQINNASNTNAINLYGGTYKRYNSDKTVAVIAIRNVGTVNVHKGAQIEGEDGTALYLGTARDNARSAEFNLYGCTINGNVITAAETTNKDSILYAQNATFNGNVNISASNNVVTFEGKTVISQLNVAKGLLVDFVDMMPGSSVKVSAEGTFTKKLDEADHYAPYFTTGDEGDWVICKDYTLYQEVKTTSLPATEDDKAQLDKLYEGREPYHGELHNHTKTENLEGTNADGNNTLEEWVAHMEQYLIDFATIVDHKQSTHMYQDAWDDACFIGGSEPAIPKIPDLNNMSMHFNMVFADAAKLEAHLENIPEFKFTRTVANQVNFKGGQYSYYNFTTDRVKDIAQSVMDHGGFFVHVHPKFGSYIQSDDPMDYWFGDHTGIEITTTDTSKYTMAAEGNVKAYEMWVDLLELNHRMVATIGNDNHLLPEPESLGTIYASKLDPQTLLDTERAGDVTAGPVGIRMSVGDTCTGGVTTFDAGKRMVVAVGDIHELVYKADHKYGIEVYDDGGILFATEINPTETNYFAMDIDTNRKFYRAVVVDLTAGYRIAVGNPVFNSAYYDTPEWLAE